MVFSAKKGLIDINRLKVCPLFEDIVFLRKVKKTKKKFEKTIELGWAKDLENLKRRTLRLGLFQTKTKRNKAINQSQNDSENTPIFTLQDLFPWQKQKFQL